MLLASEETFGPVAALFRFRTEVEAIEIANHTPYGLAAYLYARATSVDASGCPTRSRSAWSASTQARFPEREPHSAASRSQAWDAEGRITASRNFSK